MFGEILSVWDAARVHRRIELDDLGFLGTVVGEGRNRVERNAASGYDGVAAEDAGVHRQVSTWVLEQAASEVNGTYQD